jgi:murein DD-endopeptidase MepM/ murein hydrolase activator NlpD
MHAAIFVSLFLGVALFGLFPVTTGDAADDPRLNVSQLGFPGLASSAPLAMLTEIQAAPVPLTVRAPGVSEGTVIGVEDLTSDALASRQLAIDASTEASENATTEVARRVSMYQNYVVESGDTITSIGKAHGIGNDYIVWNNLDLSDPNRLSPGDRIRIPYGEGIVHSVRADDTISDIAHRYDSTTEAILDFTANNVPNPSLLQAGKEIFVPEGRIVPPAVSIRPGSPTVLLSQSGNWFWPLQGRLTSPFSAWHPMGIDIGIASGTPIVATQGGIVQFVGGNPWYSYGLHVIIDHGNGYESTYAHMREFAAGITQGSVVKQGGTIGYSGNTGHSTGPHLHFEIRLYGVPQSPIPLLDQ